MCAYVGVMVRVGIGVGVRFRVGVRVGWNRVRFCVRIIWGRAVRVRAMVTARVWVTVRVRVRVNPHRSAWRGSGKSQNASFKVVSIRRTGG